jgi:hypothetical protein
MSMSAHGGDRVTRSAGDWVELDEDRQVRLFGAACTVRITASGREPVVMAISGSRGTAAITGIARMSNGYLGIGEASIGGEKFAMRVDTKPGWRRVWLELTERGKGDGA